MAVSVINIHRVGESEHRRLEDVRAVFPYVDRLTADSYCLLTWSNSRIPAERARLRGYLSQCPEAPVREILRRSG
jgi:hypothetical protein